VFFGYYDQVHAHTYFPRYLIRNSEEVPLEGNTGDPRSGKTFSHYQIVEEGKRFIRANKDRPFFAYMPWTPPHGLWGMPKDDPSWQLYKDKPWNTGGQAPDNARIYAAMVNMVDRHIGEIRALLKELGIADKTLILFSGDNGAFRYFPDAKHPEGMFSPNVNPRTGVKFRGFKGQLYEGGLRVPFIAHWPGKIAAGRVSDHLCYFPDLMPTLAELAGVECPKDIDGLSILPELMGEKAIGRKQAQHEYLYWEFGKDAAVRMGSWKAIRIGGKPWELYDLSKDISETNDVSAKNAGVLEKMTALAKAAHTPIDPGTIYDAKIVEKDRDYLGKKGK
jgi:arylsulfatase A-like enzyme